MDQDYTQITIDNELMPILLGEADENLRYLEERIHSQLTVRGNGIRIRGGGSEKLERVFKDLTALARERKKVTIEDVAVVLRLAGFNGRSVPPAADDAQETFDDIILDTPRGAIKPRSPRQAEYIRMMDKLPVVFAIGPAGTGKTYLAVAMAIDRLQRRMCDKIILTRPVIETGETLGFLPGDILEKVDPYFRPLYDALDEMLTAERVKRQIDRGIIEVAPLAYMRGRTLNNAVVILDEAQNTTGGQMKMFLTRLGAQSTAILTGDLTQVDLPRETTSGLAEAREVLTGIQGIGFIEFSDRDVVRHRLVADILRAYESFKGEKGGKSDD